MNDEISVAVSLPLDDDGFLRRECPTCEQEFKWFVHREGSGEAEQVDQYSCPMCGEAAGLDSWWTAAQLEYSRGVAAPVVDDAINDMLDEAFKPLRNNEHLKFKRTGRFSLNTPAPAPLIEPNDDMVIIESPCHPNEPVKLTRVATAHLHCLICGSEFAA